jgi:hypothetical protein
MPDDGFGPLGTAAVWACYGNLIGPVSQTASQLMEWQCLRKHRSIFS